MFKFEKRKSLDCKDVLNFIPGYQPGEQKDIMEIFLKVFGSAMPSSMEIVIENCFLKGKKIVNTKEESFLFLSLNIEKSNNIKDCLKDYFSNEELDLKDENTQIKVIKKTKIKKLPSLLFLQLNRFLFENGYGIKNNKKISFESELSLEDYTDFNDLNADYKLLGIIVHDGKIKLSVGQSLYIYANDVQTASSLIDDVFPNFISYVLPIILAPIAIIFILTINPFVALFFVFRFKVVILSLDPASNNETEAFCVRRH